MFFCFARFVRPAESAGEEAQPVGRRGGWVSDDCFQWLPAGDEWCQAQRHEGGGNWCAKSKLFCAMLWQHCQGHVKRGILWGGSLKLLVNVVHHLSVCVFVYLIKILKNHLQKLKFLMLQEEFVVRERISWSVVLYAEWLNGANIFRYMFKEGPEQPVEPFGKQTQTKAKTKC